MASYFELVKINFYRLNISFLQIIIYSSLRVKRIYGSEILQIFAKM
jgi:hypothetical protein